MLSYTLHHPFDKKRDVSCGDEASLNKNRMAHFCIHAYDHWKKNSRANHMQVASDRFSSRVHNIRETLKVLPERRTNHIDKLVIV